MNRKLESEYENLTTHIDEILKADDMNSNISLEEIESAMKHAKLGKAVGIDNLPNEVLRNTSLLSVLQKLFNVCFPNGIVPSMWCSSIIHPILKDGKDYRDPMGNRCISLMSTVAKMFSFILNKRLVTFFDCNNTLCEEQNGFRKLRSCLEHIHTLCTILRNRKTMKLDIYLCFVDFSKAFDSVNHTFYDTSSFAQGYMGI